MDVVAAKAELRRTMRDVRRLIAADPTDRAARSDRIWAGVVALLDAPDRAAGSVVDDHRSGPIERLMMFQSLAGEPDTESWMRWCRARGMQVFVPEVEGPRLKVVPGDVDPAMLDLVVVPGLAFTLDGRRLGQGGGHYDRFLRRLSPDCVTVGVAFAEQLVDDLPSEAHDVRLQHVVTD